MSKSTRPGPVPGPENDPGDHMDPARGIVIWSIIGAVLGVMCGILAMRGL